MLYSLRGTLVYKDTGGVAVECGGVAYHCQTTLSTLSCLPPTGNEVLIYTYLHIRQEALDLFGFADTGELSCFKMLIGVSGVGPKAALAILSALSPERLALCIASGDYKSITKAQGVGPKLAQRVVLELKDKVQNADLVKGVTDSPVSFELDSGNAGEAISALVVLGYAHGDAATVVARMDPATPVADMIRAGLKALAGS